MTTVVTVARSYPPRQQNHCLGTHGANRGPTFPPFLEESGTRACFSECRSKTSHAHVQIDKNPATDLRSAGCLYLALLIFLLFRVHFLNLMLSDCLACGWLFDSRFDVIQKIYGCSEVFFNTHSRTWYCRSPLLQRKTSTFPSSKNAARSTGFSLHGKFS